MTYLKKIPFLFLIIITIFGSPVSLRSTEALNYSNAVLVDENQFEIIGGSKKSVIEEIINQLKVVESKIHLLSAAVSGSASYYDFKIDGVTYYPGNPMVGEVVGFSVTVSNVGTKKGGVWLGVRGHQGAGWTPIGNKIYLEPKGSVTVPWEWSFSQVKKYSLQFKIDYNGMYQERNKTNNTLRVSIEVKSGDGNGGSDKPDLRIYDVWIEQTPNRAGESFPVSALIEEVNNIDIDRNFKVELFFDNKKQGFNVSKICGGCTEKFTMTTKVYQGGKYYSASAEVDVGKTIEESNEQNNTLQKPIWIPSFEKFKVDKVKAIPNPAKYYTDIIAEGTGIKSIQVTIKRGSRYGTTVFEGPETDGDTYVWYLQNRNNNPVANGVYYAVVTVKGFQRNEKVVKSIEIVVLR